MKGFLVHAVMIGALTAPATYASATPSDADLLARPGATAEGEGAAGGRGVRLASATAATFMFVPGIDQSSHLVPVGEGGEGKKGRRARQRGYHYGPYSGSRYQYRGGYRRDWNQGYYERRYYDRPYLDRRYYYDSY
jgi:hypothetical protein